MVVFHLRKFENYVAHLDEIIHRDYFFKIVSEIQTVPRQLVLT